MKNMDLTVHGKTKGKFYFSVQCPFSRGAEGSRTPDSALRAHESTILTDNLSELTASDDAACTSDPKKRRTPGSVASSLMDDGKAEVMPDSVEMDFTAALKMLAMLPLSDEERAEAVRRLLRRD